MLPNAYEFWIAYHVLNCLAIAVAMLSVIVVLVVVNWFYEARSRLRGWWLKRRESRNPGITAGARPTERSISSPPGASSGVLPGEAPMRWCPVCEEYHR
jgi:hypothetical protein